MCRAGDDELFFDAAVAPLVTWFVFPALNIDRLAMFRGNEHTRLAGIGGTCARSKTSVSRMF
jgi:hypothetical protein